MDAQMPTLADYIKPLVMWLGSFVPAGAAPAQTFTAFQIAICYCAAHGRRLVIAAGIDCRLNQP